MIFWPTLYKLRRKNRLMRAGRVEEASAPKKRIGKDIVRRSSKTRLSHISNKTKSKDMWTDVRQLTGRGRCVDAVYGIMAESCHDATVALHCVSENYPQHFLFNLKKDYLILIILW